MLGGSFFDGKGEPGQVNAVSHGCAPSRFRKINVLNTARS
jgi:TldD protein